MWYHARPIALTITTVMMLAACGKPRATVPAPAAPAAPSRSALDSAEAARRAEEVARAEQARRERERAERERADAERLAEGRRLLETPILFAFDRSDLSLESREALEQKFRILEARPALAIRIEGHADERGSTEYNLALGQSRAGAARRFLTQRGIAASRIEIVSYGEERPTCVEQTEACWARNRRAEFQVTAGWVASR